MDVKEKLSLSVIIPAFNTGEYIQKCLQTVTASQYENIEIIVVNDGSTDKTEDIVQLLAKKDNRIKLISQNNGGLSSARNTGLLYATGDYILFLDSDDWLDANYVQSCMNVLRETRSDVLLTGYVKEYKNCKEIVDLFDADRKTFTKKEVKEQLLLRLIGPLDKFNPLKLENYNTAWGKFYSRSILNGLKFSSCKEIGLAEDLWFNVQVFCKVRSAEYYGKEKVHYNRTNGNSLVSSYNSENIKQVISLHQHLYNKIIDEKLDDKYLTALNNRVVLSVFSEIIQVMKNPSGIRYILDDIRTVLRAPLYSVAKEKIDYNKFENFWWRYLFVLGKNENVIVLFCLMRFALYVRQKLRG